MHCQRHQSLIVTHSTRDIGVNVAQGFQGVLGTLGVAVGAHVKTQKVHLSV